MSMQFDSRRSTVHARRGMAAASNPLAAQAGLNILRQGGRAADAAVAMSAVMNVTEPAACGIGGDCFALHYDARSGDVTALNGSGRAPAALYADDLRRRGWQAMPARHAHAVTVPGAVQGWADLLERHGSMSLAEVLADAIHYAANGFPLAPVFGRAWAGQAGLLRVAPHAEEYLPGGRAPAPGQVIVLEELAQTLRGIAEGGPQAFYEGPVAGAIAGTVQEQGGVLTVEDLKAHHTTFDTPISSDYRGTTVVECPPNGQGLTALLALNIASNFDLGSLAWDDPERMHLMVECMRLAWADARWHIADPAFSPVPTDYLLSRGYAAGRANLIDLQQTLPPQPPGQPPGASDTIYLCAVDGQGNACSFIKSLYMGFGSGIVARGTGVWLHNRGSGFSLEPGHPNELAPNKRPYHTIIPGMLLRDGAFHGCFGVMGGFMQPQGHFQVVSAMLDDGLDPQAALNRPRWMVADGQPNGELLLEEGLPFRTLAALAEKGHRVRPTTGRGVFGRGQIILRDRDSGVLRGGSEPRADGLVAAF